MIVHVWSILCAHAVISQETNSISLIEVIEGGISVGGASELPITVPANFALVTLWARKSADQPTRGTAKITFIRPSGALGREQTYEIDLTANPRTRFIMRIQGLIVHEVGVHQFSVGLKCEDSEDWVEVSRVPLDITLEPAPAS